MNRVALLFLTLILFNACSPKKGYLGPERPQEELSIVYYDNCDSSIDRVKASSEGVEFSGSGIELLPGKRVIDISVERPLRPYNCIPQTTFDQFGYNQCIDRRNRAISKNSKYVPDCYGSDYTKTTYFCDQEFNSFLCSNSYQLVKAMKYEACVYQEAMNLFFKLTEKKSSSLVGNLNKCQALGGEVRRVEFNNLP